MRPTPGSLLIPRSTVDDTVWFVVSSHRRVFDSLDPGKAVMVWLSSDGDALGPAADLMWLDMRAVA